jgi:hypothetical protein
MPTSRHARPPSAGTPSCRRRGSSKLRSSTLIASHAGSCPATPGTDRSTSFQPRVEDLPGAGVLPTISGHPRRGDALGHLQLDVLPLDLHGSMDGAGMCASSSGLLP